MDNSRKGRKNRIKVHFGMKDYYNHYISGYRSKDIKDEDNPYFITSQEYNKIITEFNNGIVDLILEEQYDFKIPFHLGLIGIRKFKPKLGLDSNGNLINKLPVNPRATRELWDSDPVAKEKKIFVRYTNKHSDGYVFTIHYYKKYKAKFKNKSVYKFDPVRRFTNELTKKIKQGMIDAYLLY